MTSELEENEKLAGIASGCFEYALFCHGLKASAHRGEAGEYLIGGDELIRHNQGEGEAAGGEMQRKRKHMCAYRSVFFLCQAEKSACIVRGLLRMIEAVESRMIIFLIIIHITEIVKQADLYGAFDIHPGLFGEPYHAHCNAETMVIGVGVDMTRKVQQAAEVLALKNLPCGGSIFQHIVSVVFVHRHSKWYEKLCRPHIAACKAVDIIQSFQYSPDFQGELEFYINLRNEQLLQGGGLRSTLYREEKLQPVPQGRSAFVSSYREEMNMPKVSIIIPVYNAEQVLGRCVDSVLAQEFKDFELLLMDDGSTDGTAAICDAYAERDGRVRVIHKENSGVSDTRNQALRLAGGEYLQFLDADDWITPEATRLFVRAAEESGAELVVSDFYRVVKNWSSHKGSIEEEGVLTREQFADWMAKSPADYYYGVLWNKLYRRALVERHQLRMDPELRWCEDFIFNLEYILHTKHICILRVPLYYYVKTEGSLVQRGLNIGSIVRMKLNVIEYYSKFYKNIYSEDDYQWKRAEVYSFLLDYSHDDMVIPMLPGSQRLGKERTLALHELRERNVWIHSYYENRLMRRMLEIAAKRLDLDYKDACAMMFLESFGCVESLREFAECVALPPVAAAALLERLALKGYVRTELGRPASAQLTENAAELIAVLKEAVTDVDEIETEGMSEAERRTYLDLRNRALENLKRRLER